MLRHNGYGGFMARIFWERQGQKMSGKGYSCFLDGVGRKKVVQEVITTNQLLTCEKPLYMFPLRLAIGSND